MTLLYCLGIRNICEKNKKRKVHQYSIPVGAPKIFALCLLCFLGIILYHINKLQKHDDNIF